MAAYQCEKFFADKNIDYLKLDIEDKSHQSLVEYFDEVTAFIRKDRMTNVLVHCRSGMSRSASLVIAYIMKTKGASCQDAYEYVKHKRSIVLPNEGFW